MIGLGSVAEGGVSSVGGVGGFGTSGSRELRIGVGSRADEETDGTLGLGIDGDKHGSMSRPVNSSDPAPASSGNSSFSGLLRFI